MRRGGVKEHIKGRLFLSPWVSAPRPGVWSHREDTPEFVNATAVPVWYSVCCVWRCSLDFPWGTTGRNIPVAQVLRVLRYGPNCLVVVEYIFTYLVT